MTVHSRSTQALQKSAMQAMSTKIATVLRITQTAAQLTQQRLCSMPTVTVTVTPRTPDRAIAICQWVTKLLLKVIATMLRPQPTQARSNSARQTPSTTTATATHRTSMPTLRTRFCSSAMLIAIPTHSQLVRTSVQVRPMLVTALRFRAQSIATTIRPQPTQVQSNSARRTRLTTTATATLRTSMPTLRTRSFMEPTPTATVPRSQLVQTSAQERPILDTCSQSRRRSIATTTMQPSLFLSHTLSTATWTASDLQLQRRSAHRSSPLDSH